MKKTSFAILFTVLITAACVFASCNAYDIGQQSPPNDSSYESYESSIRELEDQILQLQRDQFISETARNEQISKLEEVIEQLKAQSPQAPSLSPNESESNDKDTPNESETGSDTETSPNENTKAEFLYTVTDNTATITGYVGDESEITLPSQIEGYDVIAIADDAFSSTALTAVIIPDGVTNIGWFSFKGCSSLRSVTIPDSVNNIGYNAFPRNSDLSIICSKESFAAKYASSYGITVALI